MAHPDLTNTTVRKTPVIILNWNGWNDTFDCVRSVLASGEICDIWVVDNHSTLDRSVELTNTFSDLRIINLDDNYGWSGGCNRALEIAKKEHYKNAFLLNNDTKVEAGFLTNALQHLEPNIAAVGSHIVSEDGRYVTFDGVYHPNKTLYKPQVGGKDSKLVNGAGMLVSIEAFSETGGFDERYFCYSEETEWAERAIKKYKFGIKVALDSVVYHFHQGSNFNNNTLYYKTRNEFVPTVVRVPYEPALCNFYHGKARQYLLSDEPEKVKAVLCAIEDATAKKFGVRTAKYAGLKVRLISLLFRYEVTASLGYFYYRVLYKLRRLGK